MAAIIPGIPGAVPTPGPTTVADGAVTAVKLDTALAARQNPTPATAGNIPYDTGSGYGSRVPVQSGALGSRPAASAALAGTEYFCTDTGLANGKVYRCVWNGSAYVWRLVSYPGLPGVDSTDQIYLALTEASGASTVANTGAAGGTLTVTGSPVMGRLGPTGVSGAVGFKGSTSDYITGAGTTKPSSAITVMCLFRIRAYAGARLVMRPYGTTWVSPYTSAGLYVSNTGVVSGGVNVGGTEHSDGGTNTIVQLGEWALAAVTYDGATKIVYVNGDPVHTASYSGSIAWSTGTAWDIGANRVGTTEAFTGEIALVVVSNAAKSQATLREIYLRALGRWTEADAS